MYVVFALRNKIDPVFFEVLIRTHRFKHLIKVGCSGSVRDSLNFNDLAEFVVVLPSLEEQKRIGELFNNLDNKINTVHNEIDKVKEWKKGLLQKMFV